MKECLKCKIDYEDSSMFCQRCGGKLTEKQIMEEEISFCPNCGKKLNGDFEFCPECGETKALPTGKKSGKTHKRKSNLSIKLAITMVSIAIVVCAFFFGSKGIKKIKYQKAIEAYIEYYDEFYEDHFDEELEEDNKECRGKLTLDEKNKPIMVITDLQPSGEVDVYLITYSGGKAKESIIIEDLKHPDDRSDELEYENPISRIGIRVLDGKQYIYYFRREWGVAFSYLLEGEKLVPIEWEAVAPTADSEWRTDIGNFKYEGSRSTHIISVADYDLCVSEYNQYYGKNFVSLLKKAKEKLLDKEIKMKYFYYQEKDCGRPYIWKDGVYYIIKDESTLQWFAFDYREKKQTVIIPAKIDGCTVEDVPVDDVWLGGLGGIMYCHTGDELEELTIIYDKGFQEIHGAGIWGLAKRNDSFKLKIEIPDSVEKITEKGQYYSGLTPVSVSGKDFDFSDYEIIIYGSEGSKAEVFAEEYDIDFETGHAK